MSYWRKAATCRTTRMMLSKSAIGVGKLALPLLSVLAALVIVGAGSPALAWGGDGHGKNDKGVVQPAGIVNAGCAVDSSSHGQAQNDDIYYVNRSTNVNVRSQPNTNGCIIATNGPDANVVAVPNKATQTGSGYTWRLVAFFQYNCQTCTNYSWTMTGWIVDTFLTKASQGFTCEQGSGCAEFNVTPPGGWTAGSPPSGTGIPEPTSSQCAAFTGANTCQIVAYHGFVGAPSEVWADDYNPNWFFDGSYILAPYFFVWNYDWFGN